MERSLNLQKLSAQTKKKIRDAVGVKNITQLIKLAKDSGVDLGKRKDIQEKRAYQYFGEIENGMIEERNKNKKEKQIIKNVIVDVKEEDKLNKSEFIEFGYKMSEKCKKLIGKKTAYLQFTCQNPENYNWSNSLSAGGPWPGG